MRIHQLFLAITAFACTASTAWSAIEGTYNGQFRTGSGGGAWSYVHSASSGDVSGMTDQGFRQKPSGSVYFAMRNDQQISFAFSDVDNSGTLTNFDLVNFSILVDLHEHDGSFNSTNTGEIVAQMTINGVLEVWGSHSSLFTHGLRAYDYSSTGGLDYEITLTEDSGNFDEGDILSGKIYPQSGNLMGPFNGISYDSASEVLSLAFWADSRRPQNLPVPSGSTESINTGVWQRGTYSAERALGFDVYIQSELTDTSDDDPVVPEPATMLVWLGLISSGGAFALGRRLRWLGNKEI